MKIWDVGFSHSNVFLRWLFAFSRRKKIGYSSFEPCALLALKFPRQLQKEILMLKYKVKFDVIGDEWRTDRHRKGCSSCWVSPKVEFLKRFWTKRTHIPRTTRYVFSLLKSSTVLWRKGVFFLFRCGPPAKNKFILRARSSEKSIDRILLIKPTVSGALEVYFNSSSTRHHENRIVGGLHFLLLPLEHRWVGLWGKKQVTHDFVHWNLSENGYLCMYNTSLLCWCVRRAA